MKKYSDWEETQAYDGESVSIQPGAYICRVVGMREEKTRTGRDMVVLAFDIAEGEYENYYKKRFEKEKESNDKAKFKGSYRVLPLTKDGKTNPFYKGLITAIEKSNNLILQNEFGENELKGKLFGGLFGREEYEQGKWYTKLVSIRTVEAIREGRYILPEDKPLNNNSNNSNSSAHGFSIDNDADDEDLPF